MRGFAFGSILLAALFASSALAQDWQWLNPRPQGNDINDACFINASEGWAVGDAGVILHTTDGGANWSRLDDGTICNLTGVWFTDPLNGWAVERIGNILHTLDGGLTWTREPSPEGIYLDGITFTSPDTGWVVSRRSSMYTEEVTILRTVDAGLTWQNCSFPSLQSGSGYSAFEALDGLRAWVVDRDRCVRTQDGGATWQIFDAAVLGSSVQDIAFSDSLSGWAARGITVLHTTDGGATWSVSAQTPDRNVTSLDFANANDGALLASDAPETWFTHDGGLTWELRSRPDFSAGRIRMIDGEHAWLSGDGGHVACTHNGGFFWFLLGEGLYRNLQAVTFADSVFGWAVGAGGLIARTTNSGRTWEPHWYGENITFDGVAFATRDSGWVIQSSQVRFTSDGGNSWIVQNSGVAVRLWDITFTDARNGWAVGNHGTVIHTTNGGATWSGQPSGTTADFHDVFFVDSLRGWAGVDYYLGVFRRTTNGGTNWIPSMDLRGITRLAFGDAAHGWYVYSSAIYRTEDGHTWNLQMNVGSVVFTDIVALSAQEAWALGTQDVWHPDSCQGLVYHTLDGGATWEHFRVDSKPDLQSLSFPDPRHGWAVGDNGAILYFGPELSSAPDPPVAPVPTTLSLTAYPNPFNPATRLEFELLRSGRVQLTVYDVTGRQVAELCNQLYVAGMHELEFDGAALPSGIYFAYLQTPAQSLTRKLVLLK